MELATCWCMGCHQPTEPHWPGKTQTFLSAVYHLKSTTLYGPILNRTFLSHSDSRNHLVLEMRKLKNALTVSFTRKNLNYKHMNGICGPGTGCDMYTLL